MMLHQFGSLLVILYFHHYYIWSVLALQEMVPSNTLYWRKGEKANPDIIIHVSIALSLRNVSLGVNALMSMSDPLSRVYGQHWTAEDVLETFQPNRGAVHEVMMWLANHGVRRHQIKHSQHGSFLQFRATVGQLNQLLHTTFYHFVGREAEQWIACNTYNLQQPVSNYIDYVHIMAQTEANAWMQSQKKHHKHLPRDNTVRTPIVLDCDKYTAPSCLRNFYNIPLSSKPHPDNSIGIYEPAYVTWLADDLDQFFTMFQLSLAGQRPVVRKIDGGYMQTEYKMSPFNLEPNLNFEYTMALTEPLPVTNIQVGDKFLLGNVNNMLAAFDKYYCNQLNPSVDPIFPDPVLGGYNQSTDCGTMAPPNVLAITFMNSEAAFPPGYLRRQCLEFLKLGLMGVTVVVASGDWGTESGLHNTCINPDTGADNATTGYFNPSWPASCPWVTAVGGTQPFFSHLNSTGHATTGLSRGTQPQNSSLETAFNIHIQNTTASSGGGFSNIEKVPIYQTHAVSRYKQLDRAHLIRVQDRFSPVGRGYPDVALLAYRYLVVSGGTLQYVHGTSASAPVFASMISLINNDRLHAGKAPVGFINPALYSHPEVLNDVTTGFNTGCGVEVAFQSVKGWDPVTGLGSPDYERMQKLFLGLP